jgi:uncharacterized protein YkvS
MAKRFGRNQKRQMQQRIALEARRAANAVNELWDTRRQMDDLRRRAVIVDVQTMEDYRDNMVQLRAEIMAEGREPLYNAQMVSEREYALSGDRERFIRHVADRVAFGLAEYIESKRWQTLRRA